LFNLFLVITIINGSGYQYFVHLVVLF